MFAARKSLILSGMIVVTTVTSFSPLAASAQESYGGSVVGGIAGALLGSRIGGGNGKIAATAAGGILGAIVGGNVERNNAYRAGYTTSQQQYLIPSPQVTQYQSGYQAYDTSQYSSQYQPRHESQYQSQYGATTYIQPADVEPVYEQRTYVYTPPQPAYVYAQPERTYTDNDWFYRQQREEQRREWRREHDRRDGYRWDR